MEVELVRSLPNKNRFYEVCISVSLFRMQSAYKPFEKYITMFEKNLKTLFLISASCHFSKFKLFLKISSFL